MYAPQHNKPKPSKNKKKKGLREETNLSADKEDIFQMSLDAKIILDNREKKVYFY